MTRTRIQWPLRLAGTGLLAATAAIHLDLYLTGYRTIPVIGWLFLLQIITGFALALAVLLTPLLTPPSRRPAAATGTNQPTVGAALLDAAPAVAGAGFALATLGGYLLSLWVGLFGFREVRTTAGLVAGLIEVAAFAVLALLAASCLPDAHPASVAHAAAGAVRTSSTVPAAGMPPAGTATISTAHPRSAASPVSAAGAAPAETANPPTAGATPVRAVSAAGTRWAAGLRKVAVPSVAAVGVAALAVLAVSVAQADGGTPASASASSHAVLRTDSIGGVSVLTNASGRTLYWFAPDTATTSACYGTCAAYWPPVFGSPVVGSGATGITGALGTIHRTDGTLQATYDGHPLYTYIGDTAPGQASGNNLNLNGGLWHEVTVAG